MEDKFENIKGLIIAAMDTIQSDKTMDFYAQTNSVDYLQEALNELDELEEN